MAMFSPKKLLIGQEKTAYTSTTRDVIAMQITAEQRKVLITAIKIGVFKRLKEKGLITEGQYKELMDKSTK